jgi:hypothetical protein
LHRFSLSLALILLMVPAASAAILYDNTTTPAGGSVAFNGPVGDQITLVSAGSGNTALVRFLNTGGAGTFDADLILFGLGSPAPLATFSLTGLSIASGALAPSTLDVTFSLGGLALPQELIFLVGVGVSTGTPSLALPFFNPPTTGSSDNTFYVRGGRGGPVDESSTPGNIFFQLDATTDIPEPATAALVALAVIAVAGLRLRRS